MMLTVDQVLTAIGRASGRSDLRRWTKEVSTGRGSAGRLIRYAGWQADIPSLRALHPGLMTFETWLARGGAALIDRRRWIETAETPDLRGLEPSAREE
jgi:hypothetical protein